MAELAKAPGLRTLAAVLAHELRERILTGEIEAGARLQQNDVAKQYNVSTTPVREAFAELDREGLVTSYAHRGVEVVRPTVADALEGAEVEELIEGPCIAASAPRLTDDDLHAAKTTLEQLAAADPGDRHRGHQLDTAFHLSLLVRCPNARLRSFAEEARKSTMIHRIMLVPVDEPTGDVLRTIHDQHQKIFTACERRDGAAAAEATVEHIRWSARWFTEDGRG